MQWNLPGSIEPRTTYHIQPLQESCDDDEHSTFLTLGATNQDTAYLKTSLSGQHGEISASNRADSCAKCIALDHRVAPPRGQESASHAKAAALARMLHPAAVFGAIFPESSPSQEVRYYCPRRGCGAAAVGRMGNGLYCCGAYEVYTTSYCFHTTWEGIYGLNADTCT